MGICIDILIYAKNLKVSFNFNFSLTKNLLTTTKENIKLIISIQITTFLPVRSLSRLS